MTSHKRKIASEVALRGDGGVAGERRVVGGPKFYSWVKCPMPLTNMWFIYIILRGSHLGV